jgi:hypothetical protein
MRWTRRGSSSGGGRNGCEGANTNGTTKPVAPVACGLIPHPSPGPFLPPPGEGRGARVLARARRESAGRAPSFLPVGERRAGEDKGMSPGQTSAIPQPLPSPEGGGKGRARSGPGVRGIDRSCSLLSPGGGKEGSGGEGSVPGSYLIHPPAPSFSRKGKEGERVRPVHAGNQPVALPPFSQRGKGGPGRIGVCSPAAKGGLGRIGVLSPDARALYSSSVLTSPSGRPWARALSTRRMILPDRVLGRESTKLTCSGLAMGPRWVLTC